MYNLTSTNQKNFTKKLNDWYKIYKDFLDEKSVSSKSGKLIFKTD